MSPLHLGQAKMSSNSLLIAIAYHDSGARKNFYSTLAEAARIINRRLWQLAIPDAVVAVAQFQLFGICSVILASPCEVIDGKKGVGAFSAPC
jgi:hypothetical protein